MCFSFTDYDATIMRALTLSSASLSIFGSSFIFLSYLFFPRLRTFPFKLIVFLSVSDFFASTAYLIGMVGVKTGQVCNTAFACYLSAQMSQFFDVATFLWTGVIAFNVHQVLAKGKGRAVEQYERFYHTFVWTTSLILMLIAAFTGSFGDAGLWCWISPTHPLTQFFCYYLFLMLVFLWNIILVILVALSMRNEASLNANGVTIKLLSYILVFFCVRCWSVFDRLNEYATGESILALAILHSIFSPLQGFCNALVYGMNRQVVNEWRYSWFCRKIYCCRCRRHGEFASHELLPNDEEGMNELSHFEIGAISNLREGEENGGREREREGSIMLVEDEIHDSNW